jgi:hypothetical protein
MGAPIENFFAARDELARSVAKNQRPLTFFLGAGASRSSRAPSTPEVRACLEDAAGVRLDGRVHERGHEIVNEELRDHLAPLFADVVPNVGYRLLAALARLRRINIVNLNWDDAAEQACEKAGVPYQSLDSGAGPTVTEAEAKLPPERGVLIVHAHGVLKHGPRWSLLETLPSAEIWGTIEPLLSHATIVCGASLAGDLDVAEFVRGLKQPSADDPARWVFARSENEERIVEIPQEWSRILSPNTDFDSLITGIAEEIWAAEGVADARWTDLARRLPVLNLPTGPRLIELDGWVRRDLLDARVAALVSWPFAGKTVAALRLAHLRLLMEAPDAQLRIADNEQDSVAALALAVQKPNQVLVIDDPFGAISPSENPRVVDFLLAMAAESESWAYVTSPTAGWSREAGRLGGEVPGFAMPSRDAAEWYEERALVRLADATDDPSRARRALAHEEAASTPSDVLQAGNDGRIRHAEERLEDSYQLLQSSFRLGLLCALIRLQRLRLEPIPEGELAAILGEHPTAVDGADSLLTRYELNGRSYWAFRHSIVHAASERYLQEHHVEVEQQLAARPAVPSWARRFLDSWRIANGLIEPGQAATMGAAAPFPADWIVDRLQTPSDAVLNEISGMDLDDWSTLEVAYELVRIWDSVRKDESAEALLERFLERPIGIYAVLEACLYFQLGANDDLWMRVGGQLLDPRHAGDFERLLALDALVWRPPSFHELSGWAREVINDFDPKAPEFAFVRFAAGYHPDGFDDLQTRQALEADSRLQWSSEQAAVAAQLVQWHFAHQSRARAMLHRYARLDKQWLCQTLFEGESRAATEAALRLAASLIDFKETSGWGFHLICNLAAVSGLDVHSSSVQRAAIRALERAPAGDPGVVSAVLAYETASVFQAQLRLRANELDERGAYNEALADGVTLSRDRQVGPPRFHYIHDPAKVVKTMQLRPKDLPQPMQTMAPSALAEALWTALRSSNVMDGASENQQREVTRRIGQIERGAQEHLIPAGKLRDDPRHSLEGADLFVRLIAEWRAAIEPSEVDDKLF